MYSNKKEFEFRVIWRKKNPEILFPFEELEKKNQNENKKTQISPVAEEADTQPTSGQIIV